MWWGAPLAWLGCLGFDLFAVWGRLNCGLGGFFTAPSQEGIRSLMDGSLQQN